MAYGACGIGWFAAMHFHLSAGAHTQFINGNNQNGVKDSIN
jgi:hypothetical protein